jgi:hypothetical protein
MENRNGLVVDTRLTQATGTAEREAAIAMIAARPGNQLQPGAAAQSGRGRTMTSGSREQTAERDN